MNCQPGAVNWDTCAMAQVSLPSRYAPDHGDGATASPTVANGRFGVIAATSGQLRYAVIFPSRYPRVIDLISAAAPASMSSEPFSLAHNGFPVATALAVELQVSDADLYPHG